MVMYDGIVTMRRLVKESQENRGWKITVNNLRKYLASRQDYFDYRRAILLGLVDEREDF